MASSIATSCCSCSQPTQLRMNLASTTFSCISITNMIRDVSYRICRSKMKALASEIQRIGLCENQRRQHNSIRHNTGGAPSRSQDRSARAAGSGEAGAYPWIARRQHRFHCGCCWRRPDGHLQAMAQQSRHCDGRLRGRVDPTTLFTPAANYLESIRLQMRTMARRFAAKMERCCRSCWQKPNTVLMSPKN